MLFAPYILMPSDSRAIAAVPTWGKGEPQLDINKAIGYEYSHIPHRKITFRIGVESRELLCYAGYKVH